MALYSKKISPQIQLVYRSYKSPSSLIAPRDFVAVSARHTGSDGHFISYGTSINHSNYLENLPGHVRARIIVTGISVIPIEGSPNKCKCWRIVHLDPKGMIPAWVVNTQKKKAANFWVEFNQFLEEILKEEPKNEKIELQIDLQPEPNTQVPQNITENPVVETLNETNPPDQEMEGILLKLQRSVELLNTGLELNNKRLEKLENLKMQNPPDDQTPSLQWISFALIWPFITYTILDLLQK